MSRPSKELTAQCNETPRCEILDPQFEDYSQQRAEECAGATEAKIPDEEWWDAYGGVVVSIAGLKKTLSDVIFQMTARKLPCSGYL